MKAPLPLLAPLAVISLGVVANAEALPLPDSSACFAPEGPCLVIENTAPQIGNQFPTAILGKGQIGVHGIQTMRGGYGVVGSSSVGGIGVYASTSDSGTALSAYNPNATGWAGDFVGKVRITGEASFDARPTIWQGTASAGIWYGDLWGVRRQFAGVKTHAESGANQEFGIWQGGAWKFWFRGNDQAYKFGSNTWSAASDARCKKDIVEYRDGLETLERVRPVWYQYNGRGGTSDDDIRHVGVLAQDVESVAPYMVQEVPVADPQIVNMKTVDSGAFTFMLINAVKELAAENRKLRKELSEENQALRNDLAALKRAVYARKK